MKSGWVKQSSNGLFWSCDWLCPICRWVVWRARCHTCAERETSWFFRSRCCAGRTSRRTQTWRPRADNTSRTSTTSEKRVCRWTTLLIYWGTTFFSAFLFLFFLLGEAKILQDDIPITVSYKNKGSVGKMPYTLRKKGTKAVTGAVGKLLYLLGSNMTL